MTVKKLPSGRWRARIREGRAYIASKTFDTKGAAAAWEAEQKLKLAGGVWVDPKAGRRPVAEVAEAYLLTRPGLVSSKTLTTERYLLKCMSPSFARLPVSAVSADDVQAELGAHVAGWATASLKRYRGVLSALFTYAVSRHLRSGNPVQGTKVPTGENAPEEMHPFMLDELREVAAELLARADDGDIALFLGLTGLRWGELEALRVRDVLQVPFKAVRVVRSAPTGHEIRETTKSRKPRVVPVADEAWPVLAKRLDGRGADELVFTDPKGERLGGWAWKSRLKWAEHSRGRRVHDLRHTAATLWISSGVPPKTVQAWLGHATASMTMDRYAHYLPTSEGSYGLGLMNDLLSRADGGHMGTRTGEQPQARRAE